MACSPLVASAGTEQQTVPSSSSDSTQPSRIDSLLEELSVEQKVGQLIMPWLAGSYVATEADAFDTVAAWIDEFGIGGISISIGSPLDVAAKLNRFQERSNLPLIVSADLEYGPGMRLVGSTAFPMPMAIGATGNETDAYELGRITALEAHAVGIHWTFSPVADINNNPNNPIINTRSFGESPEDVARLISAYIRGATDYGLFTTAKHFPGHGDTGVDSHIDVPVLDACWDRLDSLELVPFRAAIDAGVTSVMTAHIALPCLSPDDPLPATLSPLMMTDVLKDSLGFEGVTVTDALTMGAIVRRFGTGEATVRAFLAGSDLLLSPGKIREAHQAMVAAIRSGRISMDRLNRSVARILQLKEDAGLFDHRTVDLDAIGDVVGKREHQEIADDVAQRALTLVQRGPIDAFQAEHKTIAMITYAEETNVRMGGTLLLELRAQGFSVQSFRLYPQSGPMSYDSAQAVIDANPAVLFASSVRPISGRGHIALPEAMASMITATAENKPAVLASFGSPYLMNQITDFSGGYLLAWSPADASQRAVARALSGQAPITGKLPISLSEGFRVGHGLTVEAR